MLLSLMRHKRVSEWVSGTQVARDIDVIAIPYTLCTHCNTYLP